MWGRLQVFILRSNFCTTVESISTYSPYPNFIFIFFPNVQRHNKDLICMVSLFYQNDPMKYSLYCTLRTVTMGHTVAEACPEPKLDFKFLLFLFCMSVLPASMSCTTCMLCLWRPENWSHWWLGAGMWVLGTQVLRKDSRPSKLLNHFSRP